MAFASAEAIGVAGMALKLMMANAPEGTRAEFQFNSVGKFSIGRDPHCEWVISDPARSVSGRHCEIISDGETFTLRDTSTNGVFVNGATQRLEQVHVLRSKDTLHIGKFLIQVELTDTPVGTEQAREDVAPSSVPSRSVGQRGADPAASVAGGGRSVPSPEVGFASGDSGMTIIRPAPRQAAKASPAPVPAPPAPPAPQQPPPPPPAPAKPPLADNFWVEPVASPREAETASTETSAPVAISLAPLAEALGLNGAALGGGDPEVTLRRVGAVLVAFASGYAALLAEQGQARRRLGSRQLALPVRLKAGASAFSGPPAKTLQRLLGADDASALISDASRNIAAHQQALLEGALSAASDLAGALEPDRLGAESGQLFADHYRHLWTSVEGDWCAGFEEAFRLQFGAAYDEAAPKPGEAKR